MFQNFEDTNQRHMVAARITLMRQEMDKLGIDGFIVPRADRFQGEYVPKSEERLNWLTGFSGSAGLAIVMKDKAVIFVDGRYTLQVREQVDLDLISPLHIAENKPERWLSQNVTKDTRIGFDPWLLTIADAKKYKAACEAAGAQLVALDANPIDAIWTDRPPQPSQPIVQQPLQFAGMPIADKIQQIASGLIARKVNACILTQTDAVAWAFNLRGSDIPHTPAVLAYALIKDDGSATIFADTARVTEDAQQALQMANVNIEPPAAMANTLARFGSDNATVELDPAWTADAIRQILEDASARISLGDSPCTLARAAKNKTEIEGARAAHLRDGVPMVRFLRWLDDNASSGELDEIIAAKKLEQMRTETGELMDLSFDTISGAGAHAAIPHYRVSEASKLPIEKDGIYLIDSGGQYVDGTTDITRTIIAGTPTAEMKDRFTRVLKGMINLSRVRFPKGTTGGNLDVLARVSLWEAGLDFDHGTGHGVGSYLSVHEGPQRFSKTDSTELLPGMIMSNEPGYYKAGKFGIRIENLLVVREAKPVTGGERDMLWFETLTFAPIDTNLVDASILTDAELDWLNDYHAEVLKKIGPRLLDADDINWLKKACAPINR
ncbi:MAG: aminopeptidase P family protein [Anderseniella sp.]